MVNEVSHLENLQESHISKAFSFSYPRATSL